MNNASQNRQLSTPTSLKNPGPSSANSAAPLPAAEIESLLRSARKSLNQPTSLEPAEELGPGDVQYLRGGSRNEVGTPNEISSVEQQLESPRNFNILPQETEHRFAHAILDGKNELRDGSPASLNMAMNQDLSSIPPKTTGRLTLDDLAKVDLDISIELGRTEILIEEVLKLREGSVVTLDRMAGDPVDIVANGRLIARGELLVIEGKFGVRLSEVL